MIAICTHALSIVPVYKVSAHADLSQHKGSEEFITDHCMTTAHRSA
jgi:hypothetical protein